VHVPIAGLSLLPLLLGWPLIFMPVHIAFLELVIDPVCSIVFEAEPEEADVMRRPPRDPAAPLFSRALVGWSLLQGLGVLVVVAALFAGALGQGMAEAQARTLAFTTLVLANFSMILLDRSAASSVRAAFRRPNPAFWIVFSVALSLLAAAVYVPAAAALFRFAPLSPSQAGLALACAASVLFLFEGAKAAAGHTHRGTNAGQAP
jgi:Ca2+-transporting ATPase